MCREAPPKDSDAERQEVMQRLQAVLLKTPVGAEAAPPLPEGASVTAPQPRTAPADPITAAAPAIPTPPVSPPAAAMPAAASSEQADDAAVSAGAPLASTGQPSTAGHTHERSAAFTGPGDSDEVASALPAALAAGHSIPAPGLSGNDSASQARAATHQPLSHPAQDARYAAIDGAASTSGLRDRDNSPEVETGNGAAMSSVVDAAAQAGATSQAAEGADDGSSDAAQQARQLNQEQAGGAAQIGSVWQWQRLMPTQASLVQWRKLCDVLQAMQVVTLVAMVVHLVYPII